MKAGITLEEKYERSFWPSLPRPDLKPPRGWDLSLMAGVNRIHHPSLSPDGKRIAFLWERDGLTDIFTMPSGGGWPLRLTTNRTSTQYWWEETPRWSPDGEWLAFCIDHRIHTVRSDSGLPVALPIPVQRSLAPAWVPGSDAMIIGIEQDDTNYLALAGRDGRTLRILTGPEGDAEDPRPSPDGRKLAYVCAPFADLKRREIRLVDLKNGEVKVLSSISGVKEWSPRWSPDGRWIAYLSQRSGYNEIWLVGIEDGQIHQLTSNNADAADLAWSPDEHWLACTLNRKGSLQLALVSVPEGNVTILRADPGTYQVPQWSPDGSFLIASYEDPCTVPDLYRLELEPGTATPIPDGKRQRLTQSTPNALVGLPLIMPEWVSYRSSDGQEIHALLYRPAHPNGAAILHPHGGPREAYLMEWSIFPQYMAAKGYTYLMNNYRGSTGYGVAFEHANEDDWGGGDLEDCFAGARYLARLEGVDPERIAITGMSYGGYLTVCGLARDPENLFACGVNIAGDSDVYSSWALCERSTRLYTEMQIGHPAKTRETYHRASPIHQVENIRVPMLILHGLDDDVVPPEAAEELVESLCRLGKPFEYKTYAGESHGFLRRENILDSALMVERFLDYFLMV